MRSRIDLESLSLAHNQRKSQVVAMKARPDGTGATARGRAGGSAMRSLGSRYALLGMREASAEQKRGQQPNAA
jgi:hypothetical protein